MRISTVILRTPQREPHPSIERELAAAPGDWTIRTHTDPGEPPEAWRGNRHAWLLALTTPAEWVMVIEDDAILCRRFATAASAALTYAHGPAVNFYPVRRACAEALAAGRRYATLSAWLNNQCVAMRPYLAARFLAWTRENAAELAEACRGSGDCRLARFTRHTRTGMTFPVPGLVQHAPGPSLIGHPAGRRSKLFCDDLGIDPTRLDWSTP